MSGIKWLLVAGMTFFLTLLIGCREEGLANEEGAEVSLSRVPDISSYGSLNLVDTKWELVGFVDGKRNKIRLVKDGGKQSFTQIFEDNGRFSGRASVNLAQGEYTLRNNNMSIQQYHLMTEAVESYEGLLYTESMEKVFAYQITQKGLELYYDSQLYLLFGPVE